MKTMREFDEEARALLAQVYAREHAHVKLVASWPDQLPIPLERVGPTLDMTAVDLGSSRTPGRLSQPGRMLGKGPGKGRQGSVDDAFPHHF